MLVVDASCLVEALLGGVGAEPVRRRLAEDPDQLAPHVIDVEAFGAIRSAYLRGRIDRTAAEQAIADLAEWPGERIGHRRLLDRAWELRASVRGWDAMYVALAESVGAPLVTLDGHLARADGPRCEIELVR